MKENYESLPDYLSVNELETLFNNLLRYIRTANYDLEDTLEALYELADRQWHTYQLLNETIKLEIEDWLISIVDFNSAEIIDCITSIIGYLGLSSLYETIKATLIKDLNEEVRQIITETIKEFDAHVEDPYYGMR
jgi:hypothetical protein